MGAIRTHRSVLAILAAFSRHGEALEWARATAAATWGPVALTSDRFPFEDTEYYQTTMGSGLQKIFFAFEQLIDPSELVPRKHRTNAWEEQYSQQHHYDEIRPLNLDPGYISEAKLVLASTKDRDHRLYLSDGIFAEGTLFFYSGAWKTRPWTYPDYRSEGYHRFFVRCRDYLRQRYREPSAG